MDYSRWILENNTLFQKEAMEDDQPDAEEDEFNDYCQRQLERTTRGK